MSKQIKKRNKVIKVWAIIDIKTGDILGIVEGNMSIIESKLKIPFRGKTTVVPCEIKLLK